MHPHEYIYWRFPDFSDGVLNNSSSLTLRMTRYSLPLSFRAKRRISRTQRSWKWMHTWMHPRFFATLNNTSSSLRSSEWQYWEESSEWQWLLMHSNTPLNPLSRGETKKSLTKKFGLKSERGRIDERAQEIFAFRKAHLKPNHYGSKNSNIRRSIHPTFTR